MVHTWLSHGPHIMIFHGHFPLTASAHSLKFENFHTCKTIDVQIAKNALIWPLHDPNKFSYLDIP